MGETKLSWPDLVVQKELKEATKTLTKLVTLQPEEPEYPKRTPKWFKEYININSIGKAMGVTLLAAIITGMGAFGGFPTPPKLFIQLFNIPGFRWFAVFLLIKFFQIVITSEISYGKYSFNISKILSFKLLQLYNFVKSILIFSC